MKVLNLDSITPTITRSITLKGVTHPVIEISVEDFVNTTKEAERLEREEASITDQIIATADSILRAVPSLDKQELYSMSLKQMGVIYRFISGEDEFKDIPDAVSEQGDEDPKK